MNLNLRPILFFLSLLLYSECGFSQMTFQDFSQEKNIVKKAEIARFLWNEYLRNDIDSLRIITVELLESAAKDQNEFAKAIGNSSLGSYLIRSGEIESGLWHLQKAENYFDKRSDFLLLSETRNEMGHGHYLAGKYNDAIKAYLSSLEAGKKAASDPTAKFNSLLGLGRAYIAIGDTAVGVHTLHDYKDRSVKLSKYEAAADAYSYLGMVEMDRGNIDLSREYYEKSIQYSERSNSKIHISHAYNNKAILHFNIGETDSSLLYFEQALRLRERINHIKGIIESYYNIGFYYNEVGDYHNAYLYFTKSMEVAKMHNFRGDELDAIVELQDICEELGYTTELEKNIDRMDSLRTMISTKADSDHEVVAYAEKILKELRVEGKAEAKKENSSFYVWLIPGFVIILGVVMYRRRKD